MKRLPRVSLFCAVIAIAVLASAACQKKSDGEAAAPGGRRELVYWDMVWGPADAYPPTAQAVTERFNTENKDNIHVTYQSVPWDNWFQVFQTAISSGAQPDITASGFPLPILVADMGEGLILDPIIDQWKAENSPVLSEISEDLLSLHVYEGHHYGLPWSLDPRQILYRTDYFEQAGITGPPKTWAEFLAACAKLKAALPSDVVPFVFPGGGDYNGVQSLLTFFVQNDAGYADVNGQPDYLNPKVTEVLQFMHELYVNGYIPEGIASYKATDADKLYQAGKAAIYHAGALDLKDFPDIDANSAIMPPMTGPSGTAPRYYTWVNAIQGFGKTKDPDAARAFIKWMIENEKDLWTKGLITGIPVRTSFRTDPYFSSAWQKKQIVDYVLPGAVPPVWPAKNLYLEWYPLEGESVPQEGMIAVFTRNNPDYQAIQRDVQNKLLRIWADFK